MKNTNCLNSLIKIPLLICLASNINFGFAKTSKGTTSSPQPSAADMKDLSVETKQQKKDNLKSRSNDNLHEIMSTTGDCTASCCSGNYTTQKVNGSKNNINNQKAKKKFRWFSRSK